MAGGEGTRLRPLTSNQPKPMLPMANRPMMEHVVNLLRQHGFDGHRGHGGLHGQRHPQLLRRRLRVRRAHGLRHRGDAARHGRLGAQRPRASSTSASSSSPATCSPTSTSRRWSPTTSRGALATIALQGGGEPARVRDRHHPRRRLHRALLGEAHLGPGLQRHHQHRHLRARARDLRLHPRWSGRWTSPRRSSRRCSRPRNPCSATWPRATGRTSAPSRPTCGHTRTSSTRRSQVEVSGFPLRPGVWLGKGAERGPDGRGRRPGHHRGQLPYRRRARILGEYCVLGANARIGDNASLERIGRPRQRLPRLRGAPRRLCARAFRATCARGCAARRASSWATSAFVGAHAVIKSGVKVYPFKTVEAGATVNTSIVWESRGARTLFGATGHHRPRQRRHQPGAGHAAVDGVGEHAREGAHDHGVA